MTKKTVEQRIAEAEAKEQAAKDLKKRLQRQKAAQDRKDDTRRKVLIGAVAMKHMEIDANFASRITDLLDKFVTRPIDRKLLGLTPGDKVKGAKMRSDLEKAAHQK